MWKFFEEIKDNYRERITNPFIGSFIIAWLIQNWELVFILFTFDSDCTQEEKILRIEGYINRVGNWGLIGWPIVYSFGGILVFYILYNLARYVAKFSHEHVTPRIDKLVGKGHTASKETLIETQKDLKNVQDRNEILEADNTRLTESVRKWKGESDRRENDIITLTSERDEKKKTIENLNSQIENFQLNEKKIEKKLNDIEAAKSTLKNQFDEIMNKLSQTNLDKIFNGTWEKFYSNAILGDRFKITDDEFFSFTLVKTFHIESVSVTDKFLSFVLVEMKGDQIFYFKLNKINDNLYKGTENNKEVEFRRGKGRIPPPPPDPVS